MEDFHAVYAAYHELVYRFVFRLCGSEGLSEELTQETFYQAMRGWARFRGDSSVPTWLCAIAKRVYYSSLRAPAAVPVSESIPSAARDIADALLDSDRQMIAQRLLHRLQEPYREVFTLRTFCDLNHKQIGTLFDKSESWSRVTYYRARQMLRQAMKEAEWE